MISTDKARVQDGPSEGMPGHKISILLRGICRLAPLMLSLDRPLSLLPVSDSFSRGLARPPALLDFSLDPLPPAACGGE